MKQKEKCAQEETNSEIHPSNYNEMNQDDIDTDTGKGPIAANYAVSTISEKQQATCAGASNDEISKVAQVQSNREALRQVATRIVVELGCDHNKDKAIESNQGEDCSSGKVCTSRTSVLGTDVRASVDNICETISSEMQSHSIIRIQ